MIASTAFVVCSCVQYKIRFNSSVEHDKFLHRTSFYFQRYNVFGHYAKVGVLFVEI